jgi:hypothetical protein
MDMFDFNCNYLQLADYLTDDLLKERYKKRQSYNKTLVSTSINLILHAMDLRVGTLSIFLVLYTNALI